LSERVRAGETRLRVYALLSEGNAQARVAELLGLSPGTINYHATKLEAGGYILRVKGTSNPVLYEKGSKGTDLDKVIVASNIRINATGVKISSKQVSGIPKAIVHHLKLKLNVIKEGDIERIRYPDGSTRQFLEQFQDYRNVKRWKGQIHWKDRLITCEYEVTSPKGREGTGTLYIYPPTLELAKDEVNDYEKLAADFCIKVAVFLQRYAGWELGVPELTNWQRHFAVDSPEIFKELVKKYFLKSKDGKVWTSCSEDRSEIEFDDIDYLKLWLEMPGEVYTIKLELRNLVEDFHQIAEALKEARNAMTEVARINGVITKEKAREVLDRVRETKESGETAEARPDDPEVMYR